MGATALISKEGGRRGPASLYKSPVRLPAKAEKHLALFKVSIESTEPAPEAGEQETKLIGHILFNQETNQAVSYRWSLPESVQLVVGEMENTIEPRAIGETIDLPIIVRGFTKEKQMRIALQAQGHAGNQLLGGSALVVSRPEDTWESIAPEMKRSADEAAETASRAER
jgi:hypothetical protein